MPSDHPSLSRRWIGGLLAWIIALLVSTAVHAQCDQTVPTFVVDLSASPSATYLSPPVQRLDNCCGTSAPAKCVQFILTLNPQAQGIIFNICSGAMPGGSMFYQVACGPAAAVGAPLCLNGVGPHVITFCKPGNNVNEYCITSLPIPSAGADIAVNEGCSGTISSFGFDPSTVSWTSVYPGVPGAYDAYLNCPTCSTTVVTGAAGAPGYVDYMICGTAMGACGTTPSCDTARVYFNSTLGAAIAPLQPTVCFGAAGTTITASGSGGTPPYSFLWSTGETNASVFVGAGSYTVQVNDTSDCPPTFATVVVTEFQQPITASAGADVVVCGNAFPVQLAGAITGASGGVWSGGAGQYQPSASALNATYTPTVQEVAAGTLHLVLATTGNGTCPGDQDTLLLTFNDPFQGVSITHTDAGCAGGNDGTASVLPGQSSFAYLWSDASAQSTSTATGLGAGGYTVLVTDPLGCDTTLSVLIGAPAVIGIANVQVTNESCAGAGNGSVSVSAVGGTPPYHYLWSTGATTATIQAGAGTYLVGVTDANGCVPAQASATVVAMAQPNLAQAGSDLLACQGTTAVALNGTVLNATGGVWWGGTGTFTGSGLSVQYTPSAGDLANGGADLFLTTTGNTLCPQDVDTLHITLPDSFTGATIVTSPSCTGQNNGTAAYQPTLPGLGYLWSTTPAQTSPSVSGLAAGLYYVTITDQYGCDTTLGAQIVEPAAIGIANVQVINESCAGAGDGSVSVSAVGGTPPYHYLWSTGATTATIQAGAGTYLVGVTDANGCVPAQATATVVAMAQPNLAQAGSDLLACQGTTAVALNGTVLNATGGIWSGGSGTFTGSGLSVEYTPSADDLANGGADLFLTTTGNTLCPQDVDTLHITLPDSFTGATIVTSPSCTGQNNGTAAYQPTLPGLGYLWSTTPAQTSPSVSGLAAGLYYVTITDPYGCDTTMLANITEPAALMAGNTSAVPPTCAGGTNGSASVEPNGGTPGYQYQWSANTGNQTGPVATGLGAGTFVVQITDANGCHTQQTVSLVPPPPITLSAQVPDTVCVNASVQLTAQASGGQGTHVITWSGIGAGSPLTYSFPSSQTVTVSVVDGAGCTGPLLTFPVTVLDLYAATLHVYGDTLVCPGETTQVSAALVGYQGPYTLIWPELGTQGHGPFTVPMSTDRTVSVMVANNCGQVLTQALHLHVDVPPSITLPSLIAEGCAPLTVHMPDSLTSVPVSYHWMFGDGGNSTAPAPVHNYPAGTFVVSLSVTTANGCSANALNTGSVIVYSPPTAAFSASPWSTDIDHAEIAFTDQSSSAVNTWAWDFGDGTSDVSTDPQHTYMDVGIFDIMLWVMDGNGCTGSTTHQVEITPVYDITIPNAFTPMDGGAGGFYDPTDLSNDIFYPFVRFVKDFDMRIFNRWGELVFESRDVREGWDGHYRGVLSAQDVYVYQLRVRFVDNKEILRDGDVTLLR